MLDVFTIGGLAASIFITRHAHHSRDRDAGSEGPEREHRQNGVALPGYPHGLLDIPAFRDEWNDPGTCQAVPVSVP